MIPEIKINIEYKGNMIFSENEHKDIILKTNFIICSLTKIFLIKDKLERFKQYLKDNINYNDIIFDVDITYIKSDILNYGEFNIYFLINDAKNENCDIRNVISLKKDSNYNYYKINQYLLTIDKLYDYCLFFFNI